MKAKDFLIEKGFLYKKTIFNHANESHELAQLLTEYAESLQLLQSRVVGECVIHNTDWNGKCFKCNEQVFTRKDD